jgi:hypothetical protein
VAVWMMLLTDWMTMDGMDVPLEPPTATHVAVVLSQPEVKSGGERRDQRDVGERPAHKVVTAVRGPMDYGMNAGDEEHARPRLAFGAEEVQKEGEYGHRRPRAGLRAGRWGASDGEVPVARREIQRPNDQEEGCPSVGPYERHTMPAAAATLAPATRVTPKERRWRYSQGEIRRCIPDRGGDSHHPRRPFAAVYLLRAFMGTPSCHALLGRVALLSHRFSLQALLASSRERP